MKIRRKLLLGYLAGVAMLVVVFLSMLQGLRALQVSMVSNNERVYLANQALYSIKNTQVSFKMEVQEWKDLLLRGNDQPSFDKYLGQFDVRESETKAYLVETGDTLSKLSFPGGPEAIQTLSGKLEDLSRRYREALKSYDKADIRSFQIVDKLVRGIDRGPTGDMEALASRLDAYSAQIVQTTQREVESAVVRLIRLLIILASAGSVFMVLFSYILAGRITKPVLTISDATGDLARGDLRPRLPAGAGDEIGAMGGRFNFFLDRLTGSIQGIKQNTDRGKQTARDLLGAMATTKASIDDINAVALEVKDVIVDQSAGVSEISSTIAQISGNIEHQNGKIVAQSASVAQSSAAIEQMIANIRSIGNSLNNSAKEFDSLHTAVGSGSSNLRKLREMIIALSDRSDGVLEANDTINNLATQTNLLAMNAAIEAAHAGNAGKGFAVVAGEIRKLAESSNQQSVIISENLKQLKASVEAAVKISDSTAGSFEVLVQSVEVVIRLENEIRSSLDEQTSGTTQILESLERISGITREVQTGSDEMLGGSRGITAEIGDLIRITEKVRDNALRVVEKAGEIRENIETSIVHLNANAEAMQGIEGQVGVFRIVEDGTAPPDPS